MSDARPLSLLLIPAAAPFADEVARRLIDHHREQLPDLSRLALVVASPALLRPLRTALARHAGTALLGPRVLTAQQLAASALPADAPPPLSALACRLQLAEWLTRLRSVFPDQDPARLADALFALFEDLALNAARLPADEGAFAEQLRAAYVSPPLAALSREAQIVHRLWRAYTEEIGDRAPAVAYLRGLAAALAADGDWHWLGFDHLGRAEAALLRPAVAAGRVQFWTQGRVDGRDGAATRTLLEALDGSEAVVTASTTAAAAAAAARQTLLDAAFSDDPRPARERARALSAGDGVHGLRLVAASNAEHEARIVDLAVREALLDGARRVAVVTSDRRLARRLRALLERAGLGLEDRIGWALSTSRAAAALASWLECLETGFGFRPLLDLLKCGFHAGQSGSEPLQRPEPALAARLERDVLFSGQRGQTPPVAGLRALSQALGDNAFPAVFERLRMAAAELPVMGPARLGAEWIAAVIASLKTVGLAGGLAEDDAGSQVLAALAQMQAALDGVPLRLGWNDFRALLDRHLEDATFRPAPAGTGAPRVALYTLEQTQGLEADAVILASATRAQLPGPAPGEVFFNQAVRRELGLPAWPQRQALTLARLRRVLEAAPRVTITYATGSEGENPQPSAWLEALAAFAEAAGYAPLPDRRLAARALSAVTQVAVEPIHQALPATRPQPPAASGLLDYRLSSSAHQALIECPYRFHVRNALHLFAEQAPDDAASRSDYGERVHGILHAFHVHHDPRLPEPYTGALRPDAIVAVQTKLDELADAVFAPDIAARPLAKAWRHEFAALVPWLAQALVARGDATSVQVEFEQPRALAGWTLKGEMDRLEQRDAGASVIDYKTGNVPKEADILAGENVQLPHYALTVDDAIAIEYWNLKEQKQLKVDGEALPALTAAIAERLAGLHRDLAAGHALPAHGNDRVCSRCEYRGICRRDAWVAP